MPDVDFAGLYGNGNRCIGAGFGANAYAYDTMDCAVEPEIYM
jgi:hypothetical protein